MLGKLLMAAGAALCLVGGVVIAALATGTQLAQSGYARSVQHYAEQNVAVGSPLALAIVGVGAVLLLVGLVVTLLHRVYH